MGNARCEVSSIAITGSRGGLWLGWEPIPFRVDVAFCLLTGTGIWLLRVEARQAPRRIVTGERNVPSS